MSDRISCLLLSFAQKTPSIFMSLLLSFLSPCSLLFCLVVHPWWSLMCSDLILVPCGDRSEHNTTIEHTFSYGVSKYQNCFPNSVVNVS